MTRRTFVGAVATIGAALGVTAVTGTASASAPLKLDRAVGIAGADDDVYTLGHTPDGWVLFAANGSSRPTTGLTGAGPLDMTRDGAGLVAVGSVVAGGRDVPTVWTSLDGLAWRVAFQSADVDGHLSAVAVHGSTVLAAGAHLTLERAPRERLVVRRTAAGWSVGTPTGLDHTREWEASAVAGGPGGWLLSTVDANGSAVATSPDGLDWTGGGQVGDAAVRALAATGTGVRWVANAMGGSGGITGVVGAGRGPVPVPQDARALGAIGDRSYWLADGRIVTATI